VEGEWQFDQKLPHMDKPDEFNHLLDEFLANAS
jgi:hypothetical protein